MSMTETGTRTAVSTTSRSKDATKWSSCDKYHHKKSNQLVVLPLPMRGGIVVFLMSGVCVVWPTWAGRFVLAGYGELWEGMDSLVHLTAREKQTTGSLNLEALVYLPWTDVINLQDLGSQAAPAWERSSGATRWGSPARNVLPAEGWSCSSPRAGNWCCLGKSIKTNDLICSRQNKTEVQRWQLSPCPLHTCPGSSTTALNFKLNIYEELINWKDIFYCL